MKRGNNFSKSQYPVFCSGVVALSANADLTVYCVFLVFCLGFFYPNFFYYYYFQKETQVLTAISFSLKVFKKKKQTTNCHHHFLACFSNCHGFGSEGQLAYRSLPSLNYISGLCLFTQRAMQGVSCILALDGLIWVIWKRSIHSASGKNPLPCPHTSFLATLCLYMPDPLSFNVLATEFMKQWWCGDQNRENSSFDVGCWLGKQGRVCFPLPQF